MEPTLADFLLARIAEDEATAKNSPDERYVTGNYALGTWRDPFGLGGGVSASVTRVLLECEAKRQIVEEYREASEAATVISEARLDHDTPQMRTEAAAYNQARSTLSRVLHRLALPYADHPDYRDEWRP